MEDLKKELLRLVLRMVVSTVYRMRIVGVDHLPKKGPALLVSNHLSLADGFLIGSAVPRPVRFLLWRPFYEAKAFHWLMKTMKAIPISDGDSPKEILRSLLGARKALEEGAIVCIFAEGEISRTGNLLAFKRGFEVIVKGLDVPVVPVHLDRVWGSIFSFEHGRVLWKRPRKIPYPVTVSFGVPLRSPITPQDIRQKVLDLGAASFDYRLASAESLPVEFLRRARALPRALAVADSSGRVLSFGRLAAVAASAAQQLRRLLGPGQRVGILLPPSVGGALANLVVQMLRRVTVNLNYTLGPATLEACIKRAGITQVITSRKVIEKFPLPTSTQAIYIEDVLEGIKPWHVIVYRLALGWLPLSWILHKWMPEGRPAIHDTATIMFSSGSTGEPKGVVLSHANVLSNVLGLSQVFDLGKTDRILGILPFFHSFGFTGTLWFPLIKGFSAIYHHNPLDAKTVGQLAERYRATLLLATPTFLLAYIRKCEPTQFQALRYVITGAEHLRESIAKAFEEKFGIAPLEGYGCTELSPVATVNVPDVSMGEIRQVGRKPGTIGHPIPGVSVRIVDPTTMAPLEQGKDGLLLVRGPNIMQGYLDDPQKTQEVLHDGWYMTGDIARVDEDGFVRIVDRLSRFSKIAGEMVPHILVEERLQALAGVTEPTFVVTSVPHEKRGEELVVLHARYEGDMADLYRRLEESGLPNLWIPARDRFYAVAELPYLGTGKLDLGKLRQMAKELCGVR